MITTEPFSCTWLQRQHRTPVVRLRANREYWDRLRGPRVNEVVFRNELSPQQALELVCTTEGEVDIVTEVPHAQAKRVMSSLHARLVSIDAVRSLAGVINRDADGVPLHDRRARRALNLALDRSGLVHDLFAGYARPLAGLTPPTPLTALHRAPDRLRPYPYKPDRARRLWRKAGGATRPLRLATMHGWDGVAHRVAAELRTVLGIEVEVTVLTAGEEELAVRKRLAEKCERQPWDVLLLEQGSQTVDLPPLELHRAFVGLTGEFRAGSVLAEFERRYEKMVEQTSQVKQVLMANRVDRYVSREALALFLCAPQVLYAVNKQVDFVPYATSFELADTSVRPQHWSLR